jgi:hypothetical protein
MIVESNQLVEVDRAGKESAGGEAWAVTATQE